METTVLSSDMVDARVAPKGSLEHLSQQEIAKLLDSGQGGLYPLFRKCALAVLNSGSDLDDARAIFEKYKDFDLRIVRRAWGIKLEIKNAPAAAFVDGEMIRGLKDHLFAVLRDVVYISNEIMESGRFDLAPPRASPTRCSTFCAMRGCWSCRPARTWWCAGVGTPSAGSSTTTPRRSATSSDCAVSDVCTGCGPGAMKGPMKGATIGHSKQRIVNGRYLGITEPGIIAAEPPNPIVSQLVIMPDIEKRLEAFVRLGHGIVIFPGGAGTAEEILYLLGILLDPGQRDMPFPVVFTGPADCEEYFEQIHDFIGATLGETAQSRYQIIMDDPAEVARAMVHGLARGSRLPATPERLLRFQLAAQHSTRVPASLRGDARIDALAAPRRGSNRCTSAPPTCAAPSRASWRATSRNTASTRSSATARSSSRGEPSIMEPLDALLRSFVAQRRMKFTGAEYTPCYRLVA